MYRNIPLMIAFSAVVASPAAYPVEQTAQHPSTQATKDTKHAAKARPTRVSDRNAHAVLISARHREVVAMAPMEAGKDDWHAKLAAAGPASEVTQDLVRREDEENGERLNTYGMLAAALGLGVMSIVRRMGRF